MSDTVFIKITNSKQQVELQIKDGEFECRLRQYFKDEKHLDDFVKMTKECRGW